MVINKPSSRGASSQIPNRAIIHAMAEFIHYKGKFRHAVEFLEMIEYQYKGEPRKGLSAHKLYAPNGDIFKCRENNQGALHAAGHNVNTVGAEYLVAGEHDYTSFLKTIQYPYLSETQFLKSCEDIREDWVGKEGIMLFLRHSDVSPERKIDPGEGFPWDEFLKTIKIK